MQAAYQAIWATSEKADLEQRIPIPESCIGDGLGMIAAENGCLYLDDTGNRQQSILVKYGCKSEKGCAVVPDVLARIKANWSCTEL